MNTTNKLLAFIENSPSTFHGIDNIRKTLVAEGYTPLREHESWKVHEGGKYFVTRNNSSIIALQLPKGEYTGFNIVASHCDSPTFKIKENAEIVVNNEYVTLNTERYGGAIFSTWMDRPLSIAGRVIVKDGNSFTTKLVNIDRDLLIIPNVAIHMDRSVNDGKKFNPQIDTLPLFGDIRSKGQLMATVAKEAGVTEDEIISTDLFLYNRQKGTTCGLNGEYVTSPKLDDLQCAFASMEGFLQANVKNSIAVLAVFDNEEVGSATKQGAGSTLLYDVLTRVNASLGYTNEKYLTALASSFMVSADNAHAYHPNVGSYADPTNRPYINKGIAVKYNANQKYTSDGISAAIFKGMLRDLDLPCQSLVNRSDILGGSTLGNISNTKVSLNTVDIGLPQLAMHSSYETAGTKDTEDFIKVCAYFYSLSLKTSGDGLYELVK